MDCVNRCALPQARRNALNGNKSGSSKRINKAIFVRMCRPGRKMKRLRNHSCAFRRAQHLRQVSLASALKHLQGFEITTCIHMRLGHLSEAQASLPAAGGKSKKQKHRAKHSPTTAVALPATNLHEGATSDRRDTLRERPTACCCAVPQLEACRRFAASCRVTVPVHEAARKVCC